MVSEKVGLPKSSSGCVRLRPVPELTAEEEVVDKAEAAVDPRDPAPP